jgi:cell wall-associated NlpC family hydrolase
MLRRLAGVAAAFLVLAPSAHAAERGLGLAEVRGSDGTLFAADRGGRFSYPLDGSEVTVESSERTPDGVQLRNVTLLRGRIQIVRVLVPPQGIAGATIEGLFVDGRQVDARPNALIPLGGSSYAVVLQAAVVPGAKKVKHVGVVGLRVHVGDSSLGLPVGTEILVGLANAGQREAKATPAHVLQWLTLGFDAAPSHAGLASISEPLGAAGLVSPAGPTGERAVQIALSFLGTPYVWGGSAPGGFDCSGLTMYAYGQLGIALTHYTGAQIHEGVSIPPDQLQPGDLLFFRADSAGVPQHEGMYIGGGEFVQAPHTGDVVKISTLASYADSYVGAVRPY